MMQRCVFVFFVAVALPVAPLSAQATPKARTSVSRAIVARFPCPTPVPAAWGLADSTLAKQPRCALVAAAAYAVNRLPAQAGRLNDLSVSEVVCTRVQRMTLRDPNTERVVADNWLVTFYLNGREDLSVAIDPQTGNGRAFRDPREFGYSTKELCAQLPNDR